MRATATIVRSGSPAVCSGRDGARTGLATLAILFLLFGGSAEAATYYIGQFSDCSGGSCNDEAACGTPRSNACATLSYWTQNRRSVLTSGDVVRLAPGTYNTIGSGSSSSSHCIIAQAGVIYEGRTAADGVLTDRSQVSIDGRAAGTGGLCARHMIACPNDTTCTASGFTVRDMTIRGGPGHPNGHCMWLVPSATWNGLTFDNVRFWGCQGGFSSWFLGDWACESGGASCSRLLQNVVINNSEFDNNVDDGIAFGRVNGATITDTSFHNNGPRFCNDTSVSSNCTGTFACDSTNDTCQDTDGLNSYGLINATFTRVRAYENAQNGLSWSRTGASSDECTAANFNIVVDGAEAYRNGNNQMEMSGCSNNFTVRNSFAWSNLSVTQGGLSLKSGACNIRWHNNTVFLTSGQALRMYGYHTVLDFRNNIFIGNHSIMVANLASTIAGTNSMSIWDGNIVVNNGSGTGVEFNSPTEFPSIPGDSDYACALAGTQRSGSFADNASGLNAFRTSDFMPPSGAGTTADDDPSWGTSPSFVNAGTPSVANLHLQSGDTVARQAGLALSGLFATDHDGQTRTVPWDIGADEVSSSTVTTTTAPPASTSSSSTSSTSTSSSSSTSVRPSTTSSTSVPSSTTSTAIGATSTSTSTAVTTSTSSTSTSSSSSSSSSTSSTSSTSSSTTSTAPQACDSDAECDDQTLCTTGDRCEAGFCAREPVSCAEGTACAPGRCDATAGCVIEQAPEGTPCDLGDPCVPGVCSEGACNGGLVARTGGHFLSVSRFVIRGGKKRTKLLARASFALSAPLDPAASGLAFDISAPSGRVLYAVSLPPHAFGLPKRRGTRLRYRLARRVAAVMAPEVRRLVVMVDEEVADVRLQAATETLARARTDEEPMLRWVVRTGAECVSDPGLVCQADGGQTSCQ